LFERKKLNFEKLRQTEEFLIALKIINTESFVIQSVKERREKRRKNPIASLFVFARSMA